MTTFTHEFTSGPFVGKVDFPTGLYINGKFVDSAKKGRIDVINPTNGKKTMSISEATEEDVDLAVKAARNAFETVWGLHTPGYERGRLLYKLAQLMREHAPELIALEMLDNGKSAMLAGLEIDQAISVVEYYAGWADKVQGSVIETTEANLAYTRREPLGVVCAIIPWNFPLSQVTWKLGPALCTGNAFILKPSEVSPVCPLRLASLIHEAGFPPGVVNVLAGYGITAGRAMTEHMDVDKIAFTGSTLTGRRVMEAAARTNLKKVSLELGGKSPNIIYDDCDLEQAVRWSIMGLYAGQGQLCAALTRIYVQESLYDKFVEAFLAGVKHMKIGGPFDPEAVVGPVVSQTQYDRVMSYIEAGKSQGASLLVGGTRHGNEGFFIQPTLFGGADEDAKIVKEEIFGPVGVVTRFKDEDDVVAKANDTVYGLASAVFSKDIDRAIRTGHRLQAGTVWVNCVHGLHPQVPFGGYKQSGIGRELGEDAIHSYCNVKAMHVNLGIKL
ncbi:hypothetical protein EWM64_g4902 [Hericium alpestre]|uniref:Aldehyde dehydrogenase domain-containing protein n=1 Tax=Hericium alpestre TaxID=135208 RepID=A0A4Y9ZY39_9AGAM|nr:hypothetical protein EWM64_g4902 [Hericium alpestre]